MPAEPKKSIAFVQRSARRFLFKERRGTSGGVYFNSFYRRHILSLVAIHPTTGYLRDKSAPTWLWMPQFFPVELVSNADLLQRWRGSTCRLNFERVQNY